MSTKPILFVLPTLKQAGAETQAVDLASEVNKLTPCTLVTLSAETDLAQRLDQEGVNWLSLVRKYKLDIGIVGKLAKIIKDGGFQSIHCTGQFAYLLVWLAAVLCRYDGKIVVALHTTVNVSLKDELLDRLLYVHLLRRADSCIFVCHLQMQYWLNKHPKLAGNSTAIYNGVDIDRYDPAVYYESPPSLSELSESNSLLITCLAAFRPEKRHDILLRVFAQLPGNPTLLLAGAGPLRNKVERQAEELAVSDRVKFLGLVKDVRPLLARSDVTILTSTAVETFSIAMLESMAMGVPMVSPDIGGAKEAIEHGVTGYIYPLAGESELLEILSQIIAKPRAMKEMGQRARAKVLELFTKQQMVKSYTSLLIQDG